MADTAFAPAKINLTLHVTGQRADGYHLLDSLVVFTDFGDCLTFEGAGKMSIAVTGPFAHGVPTDRRNLVWRAAELAGWTGHITLQKHLPHSAGIGGGSADAAAVLRALGASMDTAQAIALGADVPVCMSTKPQRMRGIGEDLTPFDTVPILHLVLVNPNRHVPTPAVFKAMTQRDNPPMSNRVKGQDFIPWLAQQRNDMQAAAVALESEIETVLNALDGAQIVRMSGSGATCFGIYPDAAQAQAAAEQITRDHPDWWAVATRTL